MDQLCSYFDNVGTWRDAISGEPDVRRASGNDHNKITPAIYRSEDVVLTGYVVPGCVEDGAWMA